MIGGRTDKVPEGWWFIGCLSLVVPRFQSLDLIASCRGMFPPTPSIKSRLGSLRGLQPEGGILHSLHTQDISAAFIPILVSLA